MRTTIFSIILAFALVSCTGKNGNATSPNHVPDSVNAVESTTDDVATKDERICTAIKNFLLGRAGGAVLTASAKQDLAESTWPEVQCSVEGMLDSPSSFLEIKVKKVGEGQYKYSCVCPDHGDKYTDCCTMHATLGSDGVVKIEHVTWDDAYATPSLTNLLRNARWYNTGYDFKVPDFMTPTPEVFVDEISADVKCWVYDDICFAHWPLLTSWAVYDFPEVDSYLTENVFIKNITYNNRTGSIYSGYASDGRIWYMKKNYMEGREVIHVKALVLLYPKEKQNEIKPFIDIVRKW